MLRLVALAGLLTVMIIAQTPEKGSAQKDPTKGGIIKEPLPYTTKSISRGKQFYLLHCVECHDQDGKGLGRRDFNGSAPADLTDPDAWLYGTSSSSIFASISDGTKGGMPPFKDKLQVEQTWHVVNFVRSLWPEPKRPKLDTAADPK